jgi:uncharacterized protein (TIGR02145 family)
MNHVSLLAQVIIGTTEEFPKAGALLDLNSVSGAKGGLVLSNVAIEYLWKIPTQVEGYFPGIAENSNDDTNLSLTGALVYHTGENGIPAGIYVWNGANWTLPGEDCRELAPTISLEATDRVVLENKPVTFSMNGASPRCSCEKYEWYRNEESVAFAETIGSTTLSIDSFPDALAVYSVKVKVSSPYSPASVTSGSLEIAVGGCPAKKNGTEWLFFLCHNLGGLDITSSTQTVTWQHHGDWYRFGAPSASVVNYGTNNGAQAWDNPTVQYSGDWNAADDPCPANWRVPTADEWNAVITHNAYTNIGLSGGDNNTNFSVVKQLGSYLFLPAAGFRNTDGTISNRAVAGRYWSSTSDPSNTAQAQRLGFGNESGYVNGMTRELAMSVRCVAE